MISTADSLAVVILIFVSGLGLIFNVTFLIISFYKRKTIEKLDYRWFLYGLICIDCLYTFNFAIIQTYITLTEKDAHSTWCFVSGYFVMLLTVASVMSQPLLSINRYFAMFHPEKSRKYFKRNYCLAMISIVIGIASISAYSFVPFNEYGRFGGICCIAVYEMELWHMLCFFASMLVISYSISLYCAYKISSLINHQTQNNSDRQWHSKIKEAKLITTFIYIEVFLPIIMEIPIVVMSMINRYVTPISPVLMAGLLAFFIVHGTTDPIIVIIVIKPYRRMAQKLWTKITSHGSHGNQVIEGRAFSTFHNMEHMRGQVSSAR